MNRPEVFWGFHSLFDCKAADKVLIQDAEYIKKFVAALVKEIDMVSYGECQVVHFGDDPAVSGFSVMQLIETSLISAHLVNGTGDMYWDVFSCKPYDFEIVRRMLDEWFNPDRIRVNYITRQA